MSNSGISNRHWIADAGMELEVEGQTLAVLVPLCHVHGCVVIRQCGEWPFSLSSASSRTRIVQCWSRTKHAEDVIDSRRGPACRSLAGLLGRKNLRKGWPQGGLMATRPVLGGWMKLPRLSRSFPDSRSFGVSFPRYSVAGGTGTLAPRLRRSPFPAF